jgi:hypothetical protein
MFGKCSAISKCIHIGNADLRIVFNIQGVVALLVYGDPNHPNYFIAPAIKPAVKRFLTIRKRKTVGIVATTDVAIR